MELTKSWLLWAGTPAQDDWTTSHNSYLFLGFASNSILDVTPQVFNWIKVRGLVLPLHNIESFWSGTKLLLLTGVFGLDLFKHPFQGRFLFGMKQHDFFMRFDAFKLVHDRWCEINEPYTVGRKTSLYHDAYATMLHCLHSGLNSVFGALRPRRIILLSSR